MPRLLGPLLLLLPKRRLVNQQVRSLRRIHHCRTRPRVPSKHDHAAGTFGPHDPLGAHLPPVRQLDRLTLLQLPPQVSFRNAGGARFVGIKPPGTLMLLERVPDGTPTMLGAEHVNVVRFPFPVSRFPNHLTGLHLDDINVERDSLDAELKRLRKQFLRSLRPVQPHRVRTGLQAERTDQTDDSEKMIGVEMREEDLGQREAHPVAHHLALGALAALEQERLALAHQCHRGDVALHSGTRGGGAEKRYGKHAREYRARTLLAGGPAHAAPAPPPCPRRRVHRLLHGRARLDRRQRRPARHGARPRYKSPRHWRSYGMPITTRPSGPRRSASGPPPPASPSPPGPWWAASSRTPGPGAACFS